MENEKLMDDVMSDTEWNQAIALSELRNTVEDALLQQDVGDIKIEHDGIDVCTDVKMDIVHDPMLLHTTVKQELPEISDCPTDFGDDDKTRLLHTETEIKEELPDTEDKTDNDDVRIEKEIIYVDNLKDEPDMLGEFSKSVAPHPLQHCEDCDVSYERYCTKCGMLTFVLDNGILDRTEDRSKKTIPHNLLEIRDILGHVGVFTLKTIPNGVKFGPFEGLDPVQTTTGCAWKLKGGKLTVNPDNANRSNWMQHVNCAQHISDQNLVIFQFEGNLFFRTNREISVGEELLVFYGDEYNSAHEVQTYCYPMTEKTQEAVYACTFCCLGFRSEKLLVKHKSVCPNSEDKDVPKGIVQCAFCKIYLDSKENSEHHMKYCCVKYTWLYSDRKVPDPINSSRQTNSKQHYSDRMVSKHSIGGDTRYRCDKCDYRTNRTFSFKRHQYIHEKKKPFSCLFCVKSYTEKANLDLHVKDKHTTSGNNKEYKCDSCWYETNNRGHLYQHLRNKHVSNREKKFACSHCDFRTAYNSSLKQHIEKYHEDIIPVQQSNA